MLPNLVDAPRYRVLIVDRSEDSREVLRTALAHRGISSLEAAGARQGVALAAEHHPEVIVLDLDSDAADDDLVRQQFDAAARDHHSTLVVLGRTARYEQILPKERVLAKPYHYAPLIRTIEQLLHSSAVT